MRTNGTHSDITLPTSIVITCTAILRLTVGLQRLESIRQYPRSAGLDADTLNQPQILAGDAFYETCVEASQLATLPRK